MSARAHIPLITIAASLGAEKLGIPHEHQLLLHPEHVLSLLHADHFPIPKAEGGSDHFSNILMLPIRHHQEKTRTIDVPGIAKRKRLRREVDQHRAVMLAKLLGTEAPRERVKRKIAARVNPWPPKGARKMRGRR